MPITVTSLDEILHDCTVCSVPAKKREKKGYSNRVCSFKQLVEIKAFGAAHLKVF